MALIRGFGAKPPIFGCLMRLWQSMLGDFLRFWKSGLKLREQKVFGLVGERQKWWKKGRGGIEKEGEGRDYLNPLKFWPSATCEMVYTARWFGDVQIWCLACAFDCPHFVILWLGVTTIHCHTVIYVCVTYIAWTVLLSVFYSCQCWI